jgi:hypothetical protein
MRKMTKSTMQIAAALVLLLCIIGVALAIPPPPPAPGDSLPENTDTVTLTVPVTPGIPKYVNTNVAITYNHTAPTTLACNLTVNGTPSRSAAVSRSRTESYTLRNGTYWANVTCSNQTLTLLSRTEYFSVINEVGVLVPDVRIIYPGEHSQLKMNVTFTHNASSRADCTIYLDSKEIKSAAVGPQEQYVRTLTFEPKDSGIHRFDVNCTNGTWSASATRMTNISNSTPGETLGISPKEAYPGDEVTIQGTFGLFEDVKLTIKDPAGISATYNLTTGSAGKISFKYNVSLTPRKGLHVATAVSESNETRNGTFTVLERTPVIMIAGNKTNVTQGKPFVLEGKRFLPRDEITLTLTGGSASIVNKTNTSDDGAFSFLYPGTLSARSYTINARSKLDPATLATLSFNVIAEANASVCGNGKLEATEQCDSGTANGACPAACSATCRTNACAACGNGIIEGAEDCDDGLYNGACPATCSSSCAENECAYVPEPDLENDDDLEPVDPEPESLPPIEEQPADIEGSGFMWLIIPMVLVLLIGGAGGYLAYNGTLDFSSAGSLKASLSSLFSGSAPVARREEQHLDNAERQTIKSFIYGERGKGFDDLTIRSALLEKGWDKSEVDNVFDEIYNE